ncbi:MAG: TonB-dependent receptor plug domain-containing protein, partial [Chitinophagaceae bacterium]|nr:TonB-dependent receptor plug domain-containing protein [Chitinophagaceae bacterium]
MRRFLTLFTMLMLSGVLAFSQNRVVTGTVTDDKGLPIEGASVRVKGSKIGTAADQNGNFKITVPENASLIFSGTGLSTREVAVAGQSSVSAVLTRTGAVELSNVIVTAQGIRRQPKELGYSTTRLSNTDVTQAHVTNVATGLAAKVAGLQVNLVNNGVNPQTRITLRGNRSILGNNQALLVLDDVPVDISYINSINPNDIDNVTVLKGASASALYGSEASNGVIIITTKKGTKGKPIIRYSNTTQIEEVAYLPKLQNQFGSFGGESIGSLGTILFPENPVVPYVSYENQFYGPRFNGQTVFLGAPVRFFNADGTFFDSLQHVKYSAKPNAKKDFFNKGITEQNDFSVSGGDDKSKFFFSVQDVHVTGTVPGDVTRRDALRLNGQRDIGKFSVNYSVAYTLGHTNTTPGSFGVNGSTGTFGGSYFQNRAVYWTVINTPPNVDLRDYRNWRTDPFANPNGYFNAYYGNPYWQIDASRLDQRRNDLLGSVSLNFKPASWINLLARASITRNDNASKYTSEGLKFADWAKADAFESGRNTSDISPTVADGIGYNNKLTGDFIASFDKKFGLISTRLNVGGNLQDIRNRQFQLSATSLAAPGVYNVSVATGVPGTYENLTTQRLLGAYADATIGFNDFLFLHGSVRNDWVSTLSKANRSFLYP